MQQHVLLRWLAALPDAALAGYFLVLWVRPQWLAESALRTGLLIMLVEFVLMHASAMLGSLLIGDGSRRRKLGAVLGMGALYALFIVVFAAAFREWWPLLAFSALIAGKLALAFERGLPDAQRKARLLGGWVLSCVAYIVGVMLTLFLPLPRLGLTRAVVDAAQLEGSGHWIDHPESAVAFGLLYFGFLAVSKARGWSLPQPTPPQASRTSD